MVALIVSALAPEHCFCRLLNPQQLSSGRIPDASWLLPLHCENTRLGSSQTMAPVPTCPNIPCGKERGGGTQLPKPASSGDLRPRDDFHLLASRVNAKRREREARASHRTGSRVGMRKVKA